MGRCLNTLRAILLKRRLALIICFCLFADFYVLMTIPHRCQRNALAVGVLNAIAMRVQLIIAGVSLLEIFNWMIYAFDAFLIFLIFTAIRMFVHKKEEKIVVQKRLPCRP